MKKRIIYIGVMTAFAIWAVCAIMDLNGQRTLFCDGERTLLTDYWMPRICLVEGYAERGNEFPIWYGLKYSGWVNGEMRVASVDRCYPAFALLPLKVFPASWGGAWVWTFASTFVLVGVLCGLSRSWWPLALLGSMPVIYNIERGNQIVVVAALVGVFLAWYRSEEKWKWVVAALALSAATCFKISPVILGALYLREKDWKAIGLCVLFTSLLFFVPWMFMPDGFSGLPMMLENANENSIRYIRKAEFGLVQIWRTLRVVLHQNCTYVWPGCMAVARLSQVLGLLMVAWGAWRRNILWAVVGLLWAAGNMHYYGALYLLPVLVLEPPKDWRTAALWFVILCPFQFVIMGHSANQSLCNLCALALCVMSEIFNAEQRRSRARGEISGALHQTPFCRSGRQPRC